MSSENQNHGEWVAIENERRCNAYHANAITALYETSRKSTETIPVNVRDSRPKRVRAAKKAVAAVGSVGRY